MTDIHTLNAFVRVGTEIPSITAAMIDKEADALEAIRLLTRAYVDALQVHAKSLDVALHGGGEGFWDAFFDELIERVDDELGLIPEAGAVLWNR